MTRVSLNKLIATKFKELPLTGEWLDGIGERPEMSGIWIIWGNSGNGKTYGCLKLAKYLCGLTDVLYFDLEEGKRKTMKRAIIDMGMKDVARKFHFHARNTLEEIKELLRNRKSPKIAFINSFQYLSLTKKQYQAFKEEFPDKLIIFISHAEGKNPEGKVAKFVRYDADVKIWCEGYTFFITSRYGGGKPVVLWPEKAEEYWKGAA